MITFNQPRPKITSSEMATPCQDTTLAASLQPPRTSAVVTKNKKVAVVAAARRSLGAGS